MALGGLRSYAAERPQERDADRNRVASLDLLSLDFLIPGEPCIPGHATSD